jgi:hypothetical protein
MRRLQAKNSTHTSPVSVNTQPITVLRACHSSEGDGRLSAKEKIEEEQYVVFDCKVVNQNEEVATQGGCYRHVSYVQR